jgi:hypothetical protein
MGAPPSGAPITGASCARLADAVSESASAVSAAPARLLLRERVREFNAHFLTFRRGLIGLVQQEDEAGDDQRGR